MRLPSLFLRPILHFSSKSSKLHAHHYHPPAQEFSVSNEIFSIVDSVNPMEAALEPLVPFIYPEIVTSVIQQQQNRQLGFRFFIWAMQRKRLWSCASHNLVVDLLTKENGFALYWQTLEEAKESGVSISPDVFNVLVSAYVKMGLDEKAVESFGKMKDFDCKPDVYVYNKVLHVVVRKEVLLLALAIYNLMLKSKCEPNIVTFSILIDGFCKSEKTSDALMLFDEMTGRGLEPNRFTYTIIISGLCRVDRADDAYRLFIRMKESNCSPDVVTYNALVNGFCKLGRVDEAFSILRSFQNDGFSVSLEMYSCLIDGLFRAGRYREALGWYKKMLKENVKPDIFIYTIVIRGLAETGRVIDAMDFLNEMSENGVVPDTHCYNALIKGLCDIGLLDKARSLQLEISKHDKCSNEYTYTILICSMCRNGMVRDAQQLFDEMEKHGCFPSVVTFNTLINGLCNAHQLENARLLFYKMEIGRNPSLFLRLSYGSNQVIDGSSLERMVGQLCESGRVLKAYSILTQLANSGSLPDIITYNVLIHGYCKAGNISGALKLFKELQMKGISPDTVTYGTVINGLLSVGRDEVAHKLFDQMVEDGYVPSVAIYKSFMTWSCRRKKVSLAINIWLKYLRNIAGRDVKAVKPIEEHFEKGEVEKAVRGLLELDFRLNDFSLAPYSIWLIGFCQAGRLQEALQIFYILDECKVIVTPPSCVKLIFRLCREGNLDLAVDVFLYTLEKGFMLMPRICNYLLKSLLLSKDKRMHAFDLLSRMESQGYDLDAHLSETTKSLLNGHRSTCVMENLAPG